MSKLFNLIRGDRAVKTTSGELRHAIEAADQDAARIEVFYAEAEAAYQSSLLNPDPKVSTAARKTADEAHVNLDRARALAAALRERLVEVEDEESEADKQAKFEAGQRAVKAGKAALKKYEPAARAMLAVIREVAEAEAAIREANSNLPRGARPIECVEQQARGIPGEPEEIVRTSNELVWTYKSWPEQLVEPERIPKIVSEDGLVGHFTWSGWDANRSYTVIRRRRTVVYYREPKQSFQATALASGITLPGFAPGSPPLWLPIGQIYATDTNPRDVLEALVFAEKSLHEAPRDPRVFDEFIRDRVTWEDVTVDEIAAKQEALAHAMTI